MVIVNTSTFVLKFQLPVLYQLTIDFSYKMDLMERMVINSNSYLTGVYAAHGVD